jgi:uncharacterized protein (UPF0332 family)
MIPAEDLMEKVRQNLAAAKRDLDAGASALSASRSYYAMFHAAEAVLATTEATFSSHKAVIAAFGKEFANAGKFPVKLHRELITAFERRNEGEYGPYAAVSKEEAEKALQSAEEFVAAVEKFLKGRK